jgi:hypothetical protein
MLSLVALEVWEISTGFTVQLTVSPLHSGLPLSKGQNLVMRGRILQETMV